MKNLISVSLLLLSSFFVHAAQKEDLEITWAVTQPDYQNSSQSLSILKLKNSGGNELKSSGWIIYFNSLDGQLLDSVNSTVNLKRINGDFFSLSPKKNFKALKNGEELEVTVLTRRLKNYTDYPKGFYLFMTASKETFPIKLRTSTTEDINARELLIARNTYDKNEKTSLSNNNNYSPILPTPKSIVKQPGAFKLTSQLNLIAEKEFIPEAELFIKDLNEATGIKASLNGALKNNPIVIKKMTGLNPEAYQLIISPKQIQINASAKAGVFYALQSLKCLLPVKKTAERHTAISLNAVEINDEPRFAHRGFMLDISRNYQTKTEIKKLITALALYKINVLHFHLTDDEGWRLEIPGLPELTEIGAYRGHTLIENDQLNPSYGSGPYRKNESGSGYLTKKDFVELLIFATQRHITVLPEIETPGHARAAIIAMTARYHRLLKSGDKKEAEKYLLRDLEDKSVYRSVQEYNDNIFNVALPSVYTFLEKVTDELVLMYKEAGAPLKSVHFGGDEVPAGVWEKSPVVSALLKKDPSIKNTDELWPYYFNKVDRMLKQKGLYLSGWEEIGLHKVDGKMSVNERFANNNFHADVWNNLSGNEDLAYRLANAGYKVVLTNVTNMYLDLAYSRSNSEPGQYWGGYVDVDKPFSFIPYDYTKNQKADHFKDLVKLSEAGKANIVGMQGPLWSEVIVNKDIFEYLLFPKLFGVAERSWSPDPSWATENDPDKADKLYDIAYQAFLNSIGKNELPRLDNLSGGFNYRIPTPGIKVDKGSVSTNIQYPGLTVVYTTDGSEPDQNSNKYTGPITAKGSYIFKTVNSKGRGSKTIRVEL